MAKVEGSIAVQAALQKLANKAEGKVSVNVGYTTNYALIVHEDLTMNHPNGGNAKYLEGPFRRLQPKLVLNIRTALRKGLTIEKALLLAGLLVQRTSQKEVPVDTSFLKASAFTKVD